MIAQRHAKTRQLKLRTLQTTRLLFPGLHPAEKVLGIAHHLLVLEPHSLILPLKIGILDPSRLQLPFQFFDLFFKRRDLTNLFSPTLQQDLLVLHLVSYSCNPRGSLKQKKPRWELQVKERSLDQIPYQAKVAQKVSSGFRRIICRTILGKNKSPTQIPHQLLWSFRGRSSERVSLHHGPRRPVSTRTRFWAPRLMFLLRSSQQGTCYKRLWQDRRTYFGDRMPRLGHILPLGSSLRRSPSHFWSTRHYHRKRRIRHCKRKNIYRYLTRTVL